MSEIKITEMRIDGDNNNAFISVNVDQDTEAKFTNVVARYNIKIQPFDSNHDLVGIVGAEWPDSEFGERNYYIGGVWTEEIEVSDDLMALLTEIINKADSLICVNHEWERRFGTKNIEVRDPIYCSSYNDAKLALLENMDNGESYLLIENVDDPQFYQYDHLTFPSLESAENFIESQSEGSDSIFDAHVAIRIMTYIQNHDYFAEFRGKSESV